MIHVRQAFSTDELAAIVLPPVLICSPEGSEAHLNDDTGNGWIRIDGLGWHADLPYQKWSIALLVTGRMLVITGFGEGACMLPGDIVSFNAHELHACASLDGQPGTFIIDHADEEPTPEQALMAIQKRIEALEGI